MIFTILAHVVFSLGFLPLFPYEMGSVERLALKEKDAGVMDFQEALSLWRRGAESADARVVPEPIKTDITSVGVVTSAVSAIVVDRASGAILFEKNSEAPRSIGSITKLMTAYVFLETHPDLSTPAFLVPEDIRLGGVQHIRMDDPLVARDILQASLIGSDNTATAALVRLSGMPIGDFVARMNEVAAEMGLKNTRFVDPAGLSVDNRSTSPDLVRLLDRTLENEEIRLATGLSAVDIVSGSGLVYRVENTNELLTEFLNQPPFKIVGGKTGFLPEAGYCFGAIVSREGAGEILVVVLGSESKHGRFQDAKALAAWAFKVYKWQ